MLGKEQVHRRETVQVKQVSKDDPLFEVLREVRRQIAETEKVPPFVIFSDASLKDMCAKLPKSTEEFLQVSGVGELKLKKYGLEFIQAIRTFCETNPDYQSELVPVEKAPKKPAKKAGVTDSHLETLKLHQGNFSIPEIAEQRDLAVSTVETHLLQCAQQGLDVDFSNHIPAEFMPLLEKALEEAGRDRLKPIKELLPEEVSYFMIKAYVYFISKPRPTTRPSTARRHTPGSGWPPCPTGRSRPVPTPTRSCAPSADRCPTARPTRPDVVDLLAQAVEPGLMAMPSGRFFGWVIGGTLPAALAADWLVSAWDQNTGLRYATPGDGRRSRRSPPPGCSTCSACPRRPTSASSPAGRWPTSPAWPPAATHVLRRGRLGRRPATA